MVVKQGECLTELSKLKSNSVDLIYLDPPFLLISDISRPVEVIRILVSMIIGILKNNIYSI